MENPKVSIIVPVYNVEKYLNQCIRSLIDQTYHDIEIILVDDESPDNCPQICDEWALADDRIKVIHKANEGLGFARNSGLNEVTGKYVLFVDSDDYLETVTVSELVKNAEEFNSDIVYFSNKRLHSDGNITVAKINYPEQGYENNNEIKSEILPHCFGGRFNERNNNNYYYLNSAWLGLYKTDLIRSNAIRFKSERDVLSEDIIFSINTVAHAKRILFSNSPYYVYRENIGSLTHSYRFDRLDKAKKLFELENELAEEYECLDSGIPRARDTFLSNVIVCLKQEVFYKDKSRTTDKIEGIKIICNDKEVNSILKAIPANSLPIKIRILKYFVSRKYACMLYLILMLNGSEKHEK